MRGIYAWTGYEDEYGENGEKLFTSK